MLTIPLVKCRAIARAVQQYGVSEHHTEFPLELVEQMVLRWLEERFETTLDEAAQLLTTPYFRFSQDFYDQLAAACAAAPAPLAKVGKELCYEAHA